MKVAVVTGTRAEYGLLAPLMHKIESSEKLDLQVIVTGAHLLEEFGSTVDVIRAEGFTIDRTVPEITSALTGAEVARQVGQGTSSFTDAFEQLRPDALVLLGDRYELLAAAIAAFFLGIPIVHLHGGEVTVGAFDDWVRHAISKLSRVHAVAAPEYAARLVRSGEQPSTVHVVGGFGVDAIQPAELLSVQEIEAHLGIVLGAEILVVTYHPVTGTTHNTSTEVAELLASLEKFPEHTIVFTAPNADPEHEVITAALAAAVETHQAWHLFASLGMPTYVSLVSCASAVVGNSSSGLLEAPALGTPTVNIGPRQEGRLTAPSVISCAAQEEDIVGALTVALSSQFKSSFQGVNDPRDIGGASDKVVEILQTTDFAGLGAKIYYDPPGES